MNRKYPYRCKKCGEFEDERRGLDCCPKCGRPVLRDFSQSATAYHPTKGTAR